MSAQSMTYQLNKNILAVITYSDVLNMPLTGFEIWKHLIAYSRDNGLCDQPCSLGDVQKLLLSGQLSGKIEEKNGLYFLCGHSGLVERRISAEKLSVKKLKRMRSLVRFIAYLPYVRMLGVRGSLAMQNGEKGSDWDVFVVLRAGKIWMGRTMLTGFLHLIGKRRYGKKIYDRMCLNYFVTEDNLEIGTKDLFSAHEYRFLIPLLNFPLFQIFELKNRWIREYKPNYSQTIIPHAWSIPETASSRRIRAVLEGFFDNFHLEKWLASWQREKIRHNPKTSLEGSLIEANDRALIFLPHPSGPRIFQAFKERLSA